MYLSGSDIGCGLDVDGTHLPLVSFIAIPSPDWLAKDAIFLQVNVQVANIGSIHVVIQTQALCLPSVDGKAWTLKLGLGSLGTTVSLQIRIIPT